MSVSTNLGGGKETVTYRLYRTIPKFQPRDDDLDAIRGLSMPMVCDDRDDALGHARRAIDAGCVAMLIEGSDGSVLSRIDIIRELRVRADQLRGRPLKY
jgi:hypothetical protein